MQRRIQMRRARTKGSWVRSGSAASAVATTKLSSCRTSPRRLKTTARSRSHSRRARRRHSRRRLQRLRPAAGTCNWSVRATFRPPSHPSFLLSSISRSKLPATVGRLQLCCIIYNAEASARSLPSSGPGYTCIINSNSNGRHFHLWAVDSGQGTVGSVDRHWRRVHCAGLLFYFYFAASCHRCLFKLFIYVNDCACAQVWVCECECVCAHKFTKLLTSDDWARRGTGREH